MSRELVRDIVVIGGGSAGLAAAIAAFDAGVTSVLVIERDLQLGGILNQCIHNGFGLQAFKEELTGPEYAARFVARADERGIERMLGATVLEVSPHKVVRVVSPERGVFSVRAKAVILAMGCRERARGALNIAGYRPAGIYSAGTAQRLVNVEGKLPGREVVILGSGDIGLIMARRMTLEGAHVACVAEVMPYSGGLKRNIVQCLEDFGIPLRLSHTVVDIEGKRRVEAVTLAAVDERGHPIAGTEERVACDALLLSVGLVPENELSGAAGIDLSPVTHGPLVNEGLETSVAGIFACGNVLHVHNLVDYVSEEAAHAGRSAAAYVMGAGVAVAAEKILPIRCGEGVRYVVPTTVAPSRLGDDGLLVRFRVDGVYENRCLSVFMGARRVLHHRKPIVAPGEMQEVRISLAQLEGAGREDAVTIALEED